MSARLTTRLILLFCTTVSILSRGQKPLLVRFVTIQIEEENSFAAHIPLTASKSKDGRPDAVTASGTLPTHFDLVVAIDQVSHLEPVHQPEPSSGQGQGFSVSL